MWTEDHDRDLRSASGDRLFGRSHGGNGSVLLEVKTASSIDFQLKRKSSDQCCDYLSEVNISIIHL